MQSESQLTGQEFSQKVKEKWSQEAWNTITSYSKNVVKMVLNLL